MSNIDDDAMNRFMDQLERDLIADNVRPVEFYQAAYPRCALKIIEAYASMTGRAARAAPRRQIGDYKLLNQIGSGGTSIVYSALTPDHARLVALKVMTTTLNEKRIKRFLREAAIVERLEHDGIARILDHGEDDDNHYLAVEWIDGRPLSKAIVPRPDLQLDQAAMTTASGDRASVNHACKTVAAILRALAAAHADGVVHRDLKPANVMVDARDRIVLIDFGFAADSTDNDNSLSLPGDVIGTHNYMAPEQLKGRTTGGSVDIWAAGVVLYELLTGRRPFDGPTDLDISKAIHTKDPINVRRLNRSVGSELAACIEMALCKKAEGRYASAEHFADDLDRVVRGEPVLAKRVGSVQRVARMAQRHPLAAAFAGFVVVAAVAIALLSYQAARGWEAKAATTNDLANVARTLAHVINDSARYDAERGEGEQKGLAVGYANDDKLRRSLNRANSELKQLAHDNPAHAGFVSADALVADSIGLIHFELNRFAQARPLFARAVDRNRKLRELQPQDALHRSNQVRAMLRGAMTEKEDKQFAEAMHQLVEAHAEARRGEAEVGIKWAKEQGAAFNNIANLYMELGDYERGYTEFVNYEALLPPLAESNEPTTRDWILQQFLCVCCAVRCDPKKVSRVVEHIPRLRSALARWDEMRAKHNPPKPSDKDVEHIRQKLVDNAW